MKKLIDAKGLACPQPVINTKKAVEEGGFSSLEVIVDNEAAKENVTRFLKKSGFDNVKATRKGDEIILQVQGEESGSKKAEQDKDQDRIREGSLKIEGKAVFIGSDKIGEGSDELGGKLMTAFIYTLTETSNPPRRLVFMNSGVKLCVKGAETVENLMKLNKMGIEILVCGTCLNYFGLSDQLAVGTVSNMYDIVDSFLGQDSFICL